MLKNIMNINKDNRGSVTVETAIIFPLFMAVILAAVNIISIVNQYEMVNSALNKTCSQMADYAYLYHERGITELGDAIKSKANGSVNNIIDEILNHLPFETQDNSIVEAIKGFILGYVNDQIDNADDQIYIPAAAFLLKNNLETELDTDFNLSKSEFFNGNNNIKLSLSYKLNIAIPFLINSDIVINQECVMNSWMSGIGGSKPIYSDNIWDLDNFERGRRIRKIFGANLPDNFPVISSYNNGRITIIKSLDFTADTYLKTDGIYKRLKEIINSCKNYHGQPKPWGKNEIIIRSEDIAEREVILVIPSDPMNSDQEVEFDRAEKLAKSMDVILRIEKYGYKKG